jgi:hypothetical protein
MISATGWWDPAFGLPERGDASVAAAVFVDEEGQYWLHGVRYLTHDPALSHQVDEATQLSRKVVDFARSMMLPSITVETNGLGRFLPAILRREFSKHALGCGVVEHVSRTSKDQRILDALDPVLAAMALHVHRDVYKTPFVSEMRDWRPGQNCRDDGLDAVSGCILAEPVRLKRQASPPRPNWRAAPQQQSADSNFVP